MNLLKLPDPYREALACWEALRRLGFPSDDIYFLRTAWGDPITGAIDPATDMVRVVLRTQSREFTIDVGLLERAEADKFEEKMQLAMVAINSGAATQKTLDRIWKRSDIGSSQRKFLELVYRLGVKGINCGAVSGTMN